MNTIEKLESEIAELRVLLTQKEVLLASLLAEQKENVVEKKHRLTNKEISRYSRQIILNEIGVKGQLALKHAAVLIVGAGGLGMYAT